MKKTLKLVLKYHWYSQIEYGKKVKEYREYKDFWIKRLYPFEQWGFVEFQKGYSKNPPKMLFEIKKISLLPNGTNTDLSIKKPIFEITLGNRLK